MAAAAARADMERGAGSKSKSLHAGGRRQVGGERAATAGGKGGIFRGERKRRIGKLEKI